MAALMAFTVRNQSIRRIFQSQNCVMGVAFGGIADTIFSRLLSTKAIAVSRGCCNEIDVAIADRGLSSCISVGNNRNFSKAKYSSCDRPCALSSGLWGRFRDHRSVLGSTLAAVPVDRAGLFNSLYFEGLAAIPKCGNV
jgi:hypothetical protein